MNIQETQKMLNDISASYFNPKICSNLDCMFNSCEATQTHFYRNLVPRLEKYSVNKKSIFFLVWLWPYKLSSLQLDDEPRAFFRVLQINQPTTNGHFKSISLNKMKRPPCSVLFVVCPNTKSITANLFLKFLDSLDVFF